MVRFHKHGCHGNAALCSLSTGDTHMSLSTILNSLVFT